MKRIEAKSKAAQKANRLVEELQHHFVEKLNALSRTVGTDQPFKAVEWLRDEGTHGGGVRFEAQDEALFNRGSVNVSQVHYDGDETKKLGSATAVSTIIHPLNPHAPSMHMHISWTEMKDGKGYWRMMADLNPSIENTKATDTFTQALLNASPEHYDEASAQGDHYFYIPALKRHRGVTHFYLENFHTDDAEADYNLARDVGLAVIDTYISLIDTALKKHQTFSEADREKQLAYHTLYLFQVLTLDRGTTSGLLIHNQNDVGILGSIPSQINKLLLRSWKADVPAPQDKLVDAILDALPDADICDVENDTKAALAEAVRQHYMAHPEALSMQASGNTTPTTVQNHK